MIREIITPKQQKYTLQIPVEYIDREVEILILPFGDNKVKKKKKSLELTTFKKGKKLKKFSRKDAYRGSI